MSLQNLDAAPELNTRVDAEIDVFLTNFATNTTMSAAYTAIIEEVIHERGKPVLWFFGAAVRVIVQLFHFLLIFDSQGLTLLTLASLSFVLNWPRGKL
jgi:hypothetical protein